MDLKLYNPQPHIPADSLQERLRLARFYVDITRTMYGMAFPKKKADLETLLTFICIFIGDAEGRPTTATKIASHSGLSRTTVYRRLHSLMRLKKIVRVGRNYHLAQGAVTPDKYGRLQKVLDSFVNR